MENTMASYRCIETVGFAMPPCATSVSCVFVFSFVQPIVLNYLSQNTVGEGDSHFWCIRPDPTVQTKVFWMPIV